MKIRPLGHRNMQVLYERGQMFYCGMTINRRLAHCKVCGTAIPKGTGERWLKFGPNNDFHFQPNYFCSICNAFWVMQDHVSFYETIELYGNEKDDLIALAKEYIERENL